jgi:hypothetical protein
MLWTRLPDARPSMATLAADMSASLNSAKRAVRELEAAGLIKRIHRLAAEGDSDTNRFELMPVLGRSPEAPPPGLTGLTGTAPQAPKDSNTKTASEGREKSQGSRRARPAVSRELSALQKVQFVREAAADVYGSDEAQEISDGQALQLWWNLASDERPPAKPVAYFTKIFTETPYLDTHLASCDPDYEPW